MHTCSKKYKTGGDSGAVTTNVTNQNKYQCYISLYIVEQAKQTLAKLEAQSQTAEGNNTVKIVNNKNGEQRKSPPNKRQ